MRRSGSGIIKRCKSHKSYIALFFVDAPVFDEVDGLISWTIHYISRMQIGFRLGALF